ncbi:MAG TPA: PEP-CTERM sorting domain-containing protein [Chthoniobacteraceae bacterium]|nr:PEP-CTERM sorting domain-containing protein [Chthoniobacteraceae bacterium]
MKPIRRFLPLLLAAPGLALSLLCANAQGQTTYTWITETHTTDNPVYWDDDEKWVGGAVPAPGASAINLDFSNLTVNRSGATYFRNNVSGSAFNVFQWKLADAATSMVYTVDSGAAPIHFVQVGGVNPSIVHDKGSALQQFQFISLSNIVGTGTVLQITGAATGRLNLSTVTLSGEGGIRINKPGGDILLRETNSFAGDFTLAAGVVTLTSSTTGPVNGVTTGPLGKGTVVLSGGMLRASGAERNLGNRVQIEGDFQAGDASANNKNIVFEGDTLLAGTGVTRTITGGFTGANAVDQNTVSFTGAITDGGNANGLAFALGTSATRVILSGANTYTGDTTVNGTAASSFTLAETGSLRFTIGANGENNRITGNGVVQLDGTFTFDLTGAGVAPGDEWNLVDVATLSVAYGNTFNLADFTSHPDDTWSKTDGTITYTFFENTGTLQVTAVPEPSAVALLVGGLAAAAVLLRRRTV